MRDMGKIKIEEFNFLGNTIISICDGEGKIFFRDMSYDVGWEVAIIEHNSFEEQIVMSLFVPGFNLQEKEGQETFPYYDDNYYYWYTNEDKRQLILVPEF